MSLASLLGRRDDWRDAAVSRADLLVAAVHAAMLEQGYQAVDPSNGNEVVTDARMLREWQAQEICHATYAPLANGDATMTLSLVHMGEVLVVNLMRQGSVRLLWCPNPLD